MWRLRVHRVRVIGELHYLDHAVHLVLVFISHVEVVIHSVGALIYVPEILELVTIVILQMRKLRLDQMLWFSLRIH